MTNKDFIKILCERNDITPQEAQQWIDILTQTMADSLTGGDTITIQGFGNFEVKKKLERVIVNPTTKQRQLIPPKLVVGFKPSPVLKDKIKQ